MSDSNKTKIILIDDHPLMRKGVAMTLEEEIDFDVVAQASDAESSIAMFDEHKPDVAIIDISLPGMNGLELLKHVISRFPDVKCLIVSRHEEELYAERAIRAGARGYLMKVEAGDKIVQAVRQVINGGLYLSSDINQKILMNLATGSSSANQTPLEILSDRELEVFELIGNGVPTKEIAAKMHVSVKTIESYRSRIKQKLKIESASELMHHAVKWVQS